MVNIPFLGNLPIGSMQPIVIMGLLYVVFYYHNKSKAMEKYSGAWYKVKKSSGALKLLIIDDGLGNLWQTPAKPNMMNLKAEEVGRRIFGSFEVGSTAKMLQGVPTYLAHANMEVTIDPEVAKFCKEINDKSETTVTVDDIELNLPHGFYRCNNPDPIMTLISRETPPAEEDSKWMDRRVKHWTGYELTKKEKEILNMGELYQVNQNGTTYFLQLKEDGDLLVYENLICKNVWDMPPADQRTKKIVRNFFKGDKPLLCPKCSGDYVTEHTPDEAVSYRVKPISDIDLSDAVEFANIVANPINSDLREEKAIEEGKDMKKGGLDISIPTLMGLAIVAFIIVMVLNTYNQGGACSDVLKELTTKNVPI